MKFLSAYRWWIALAVFAALVLALRPWTVRPVVDGKAVLETSKGRAAFDAGGALSSRLSTLAPVSAATATDKVSLLQGEGRVLEVDTSSRIGWALIDLAPGDGSADVAMQIGPVTTGVALRDVLGYGFGDFESQMTFAQAGDALNAYALESLPALKEPQALEGKTVRFTGAGARAGGRIEILPVSLEIVP